MNIGSRDPVNQLAGEALMVPPEMVVRDELANRAAKMAFTERDHAIEALLSDRSNEPLRVGVTVGCVEWRPMTRTPSYSRKSRTARLHFRFTITNHDATASDEASRSRRSGDAWLDDERFVRIASSRTIRSLPAARCRCSRAVRWPRG